MNKIKEQMVKIGKHYEMIEEKIGLLGYLGCFIILGLTILQIHIILFIAFFLCSVLFQLCGAFYNLDQMDKKLKQMRKNTEEELKKLEEIKKMVEKDQKNK